MGQQVPVRIERGDEHLLFLPDFDREFLGFNPDFDRSLRPRHSWHGDREHDEERETAACLPE
jgi:hypothetical protein